MYSRNMRSWHVIPIISLLAVLGLAGCGGSSSSNPTAVPASLEYHPALARIPACAHAGRAIALPAGFPTQFPFPGGTSINLTKKLPGKGQIGIYGFVPAPTFATAVNFFKSRVPRAGFKEVDFEVDSPNDSEGTYQGHGTVGRWQLQTIPGCKAMTFAASAEPVK